jgi:uncharacterized membrane protein
MTAQWATPTRWTLISACWAIGITIATVTYLGILYPMLPDSLPVRYLRGEPVIFQTKTTLVVLLPALVQSALLLTFGALASLLLWRPRRASLDTLEAADRTRMSAAVEGIALLGAVWISVQALGAARLVASWQGERAGFGQIYNLTLLVSIALSVAVVWRTMRAVKQDAAPQRETDPAFWRLTHLYFNPADPALFAPTRRGVGWTLNFGRPLAILLIAVVLAIGVGGPFFLVRSVLWDGSFVMLRMPARQ